MHLISFLPTLLLFTLSSLPLSLTSPLPLPQPAQTLPLPALIARQAYPTPFAPPLNKRNNVQVPSDATALTRTDPVDQASSAIAASSQSAASASQSAVDSPVYNNFFGAGIPSSMLIYVAAAIAIGVLLSLLLARYFFIKRHYPPTLRAYFIPLKGLHIPFLRIHISGPPPRPDRRAAPPSYGVSIMQRRSRRDRTTRGEGIGEGGRRRGARDGDDAFEGEEEQGGSTAEGGGGADDLPMYVLETGLPGYHTVDGEAGTRDGNPLPPPTALATSASTTTTTTTTATALPAYPPPTATSSLPSSHNHESGDDSLPSVQAYELATRRARARARDALSPIPSPPHPAARPASSRRETAETETDRNSIGTASSSSHTKVEDGGDPLGASAQKEEERGVEAGAGRDEYKEAGECEMIERVAVPVTAAVEEREREGEREERRER